MKIHSLPLSALVVFSVCSYGIAVDTEKAVLRYLQTNSIEELASIAETPCTHDESNYDNLVCHTTTALYQLHQADYQASFEHTASAMANIEQLHHKNLPVLWDKYFTEDALKKQTLSASEANNNYKNAVNSVECQRFMQSKKNDAAAQMPSEQEIDNMAALMATINQQYKNIDLQSLEEMSATEREGIDYAIKRKLAEFAKGISPERLKQQKDALMAATDSSNPCNGPQAIAEPMLNSGSNLFFYQYQEEYQSLTKDEQTKYKRNWHLNKVLSLDKIAAIHLDQLTAKLQFDDAPNMAFTLQLSYGGELPYLPTYIYLKQAQHSLTNGNADRAFNVLHNAVKLSLLQPDSTDSRTSKPSISLQDYQKVREFLPLLKSQMRKSISQQANSNVMGAQIMIDAGMYAPSEHLERQARTLQTAAGPGYLPTEALAAFVNIATNNPGTGLATANEIADRFAGSHHVKAVQAELMWYAVATDMWINNVPDPSVMETMAIEEIISLSTKAETVNQLARSYDLAKDSEVDELISVIGTTYAILLAADDAAHQVPAELRKQVSDFKSAFLKSQRQQKIYFADVTLRLMEHMPLHYLSL